MHQRLDELAQLLALARAEVMDAVAMVGNPVPPAGAWSVPEVLDHLQLVEAGVSRLVHVQLSRHPGPLPRETRTASVAHALDFTNLGNRDRRIVAPETVRPRAGIAFDEATSALVTSRERLLETLKEAEGIALDQFSWPHPTLGPLDLYQWVLFVGLHERRHARQIAEMTTT